MLEKYFKHHSEKFAIPFIKLCIFLKVKPNFLSFLGLVIVCLGSYFFFTVNRIYGVIFIFLGSAIDGLDGPLARSLNIQSDRGALIDSTIDRVGELIIWSVIGINYVNSGGF